MNTGLQDKVAVVTGAGGGIGAEICRTFADEGCRMGLVDYPGEPSTAAVASDVESRGGEALVLEADVTDAAAVERACVAADERWGGIDILICCAGITRDALSWKLSEEDFDAVIAVNLKGVFLFNRAVATRLRERGWGRIVNVASINGMRGKFGQSNYAASKGGVIALTKSMARELGRYAVTVNCVAPGMVMTEMAKSIPQDFVDAARAETVLGHLAEASDVAQAILFLCSEGARHITGEVLRVDGGQYI